MPNLFRAAVVAALIVCLVAACAPAGGAPADSPSGPPAGLTTMFEDVTLAPDVTTVDAATVRSAYRSSEPSEDGTTATLRFAAGTATFRDLEPGTTALLEGVGVRRIDAVRDDGDEIVVETSDGSLGDVVRSGTIGWDYDVRWDEVPTTAWDAGMAEQGLRLASVGGLPPDFVRQMAARGEELKFQGQVKGFEVEFKLTPRSDKLDFELSASRVNIKVQVKGFVSTFHQETRLEYREGDDDLFETEVTGMRGEAEVEWAAFQVDNEQFDDDITALEIPLAMEIPFAVGPLPMTLRIKFAARFVPALSAGESSSGGSFKVTYDSDHGFSSNRGTVNPVSGLRSWAADLGQKATVTAGHGPTGFGFGFEFPRLEVALGAPLPDGLEHLMQTYLLLTLNNYVNGQYTPGTTLTADIPPCQRASILTSVIAGYKLAVLGMAQLSDNTTLWEKTQDHYLNDKPCTLTGE